LLEKTNNNEPLNRFNKKCQVKINFERGVLLLGASDFSSFNENLSAFQYNQKSKSGCSLRLYCIR